MSRSKSLKWKADRIFHRCNPEWENATDENPILEDSEREDRCDAAGCMDVDVKIRGTSHSGNISGPADDWEEPSCDVDDAEFCVGWQHAGDGIYHAEEFSSAREFAAKNLPETLWYDFEQFCEHLAETALDSDPETD